ncbi:hypothetical protein KIL84_006241 [Mauremys mutica]|uniref:Uncharacterized protein n=1 Tax=Mauremys mutica TaxID=74926 RepID=A0A9D4ATV5_9SAUR|nr:hypothetical protein KIL84_006241 [Mauremys mutica]
MIRMGRGSSPPPPAPWQADLLRWAGGPSRGAGGGGAPSSLPGTRLANLWRVPRSKQPPPSRLDSAQQAAGESQEAQPEWGGDQPRFKEATKLTFMSSDNVETTWGEEKEGSLEKHYAEPLRKTPPPST